MALLVFWITVQLKILAALVRFWTEQKLSSLEKVYLLTALIPFFRTLQPTTLLYDNKKIRPSVVPKLCGKDPMRSEGRVH